MDKKKAFPVWLGMAAIWFGSHCGTGFATGKQYTVFYGSYGWTAIFMPLITWTILAVSLYFAFEYGRVTNAQNYKDYAKSLFIPKFGIFFVIVFDLWCLLAQILGLSGILAGSGALFQDYGLNYWIGVIISAVLVLLCIAFGANFLMKTATILTGGLIVCILVLSVVGVFANWDNFVAVLSQRQVSEGTTFLKALGGAFNYAGVQISILFAMLGLSAGLGSRKDSAKAAFGGGALNVVMLMTLGLVMIATFPGIISSQLPVLTAIKAINIPILSVVYVVMLYLAMITTGYGCAFAIISRYKEYPIKFGLGEMAASVLVAILVMAISIFAARFGLTVLIVKGYTFMAKLSWPLGIIPALTIAPIRLYYMKKNKINVPAGPKGDT